MPEVSVAAQEPTGASGAHQTVSSICGSLRDDFCVIWHQLAYRVDPRPWHVKVKSRMFPVREPQVSLEEANQTVADGQTNATGKKLILNRICGEARSGEITAILGPSGAGKSTLLHCLFQNRTEGTSGKILVDGCSQSKLRVCFIPQQDYINEWLTVREDLVFVSKLKFAGQTGVSNDGKHLELTKSHTSRERLSASSCSTSSVDHEANAIRVAELLRLESCLDVRVKNISGGQRKLLSIARELMSKPNILVLDEPTTGLDSLTCQKTVHVLRDLVQTSAYPMAIVVTIHQPQSSVFNLFDKTYFISSGGRVIYDDRPKNVAQTMETVAGLRMPSASYNPAAYLIDVASDPRLSPVAKLLADHQEAKFAAKYQWAYLKGLVRTKNGFSWPSFSAARGAHFGSAVNEAFDSTKNGVEFQVLDGKQPAGGPTVELDSSAGNDYYISHQLGDCLTSHESDWVQSFLHISILSHRCWLSLMRNPSFTRSRLVFHVILPMFIVFVFGLNFGRANSCPKYEAEVSVERMLDSIERGTIEENVRDARSVRENLGFYFILMYGFGLNIITSTAAQYPLTMRMLKKEVINGLYRPTPYLVGQTLAEIPLEIFFPTISVLISYHASGGEPSALEWRMLAAASLLVLVSYSCHAIGLLCGSVFVNSPSAAVLVGQATLIPFICLSGFLLTPARMPDWMFALSRLSLFGQAMGGVVSARYGFNLCRCEPELIAAEGPSVGGLTPQVRRVLEYLFPPTNDTAIVGDSFAGQTVDISELFDKLATQFVKAQTFGREIRSCEDVQPYAMHMFRVGDMDLLYALGSLLAIILMLKLTTFFTISSFPYRLN